MGPDHEKISIVLYCQFHIFLYRLLFLNSFFFILINTSLYLDFVIDMGNSRSKPLKLPSRLDLVKAAQNEYDFLHMVDSTPTLHCVPVLQNAVHRYEKYWLPLMAEHPTTILPAPLDIEWVWHCHILSPVAYQKDCQKVCGTVIDHCTFSIKQRKKLLIEAEKLWNKKHRGIPFSADLSISAPPLITSDVPKSTYDIVAAAQKQQSFNYSTSLPHYRDPLFLKSAVKRYETMLMLKKENPAVHVVTCYDNGLIWHSHKLHPKYYNKDTVQIIGCLFHQDDATNDGSLDAGLFDISKETRDLWRAKKQKFAVPGTMFRGNPTIWQSNSADSDFKAVANKVMSSIIGI